MVRKIFFLGLLFVFLLTTRSFAQDNYSRFELGAQYSTIRQTNSDFAGTNFSGFGGRFDWNLNRRLAFESQVDFFPENGVPLPLVQGGQTLQAVFGIRAKVVQNRHFSVFGLVRPGLLHFSSVQVLSGGTSISYTEQPATYFVLNLGGGIEYYPSPRWVLRFDIEGNPYRVPAFISSYSGGGTAVIPGKINDTTRLSFGVAYRPGPLTENGREINVPGKWEFGPLFSAMMISREGLTDNVTDRARLRGLRILPVLRRPLSRRGFAVLPTPARRFRATRWRHDSARNAGTKGRHPAKPFRLFRQSASGFS